MGFAETVLVNIDIQTGKGASALGDLKSKIGDAEGGLGKFKAAASGAGDVLNAMPLPVVGAAALAVGAAVIKLGNEFTAAALDAQKMADATGINVEKSSEWIAAADDVGISTDQISAAFGKATKALGTTPAAFEALGVSVVHAKDGTVDMNETLLGAIDTIDAMQDPTKKAELAAKLFGKSWQELTPLLEKGSGAIRETMAATSDAQRITDEEVKSAKEWQATMDNLGDVIVDLKMNLGGLIVQALGPAAEAIAEMAAKADDLQMKLGKLAGGDAGTGGPIGAIGKGFAFWVQNLSPVGESIKVLEGATAGVEKLDTAVRGAGAGSSSWGDEMLTANERAEKFGRSLEVATSRTTDGAAASAAYGEVQKDAAADTAAATKATEDATKALEAHTKAIEVEINAVRAANDADFAMAESKDKIAGLLATVTEQMTLNTDANSTNNVSQQDVDKTARDLSRAYEEQAGILGNQLVAAQEAATGATADGVTKQRDFALGLVNTANTLAPDSPLRQHLTELATAINDKLPADKKINVNADTAEAQAAFNALLDIYNQLHSKTIVIKGVGGPTTGVAAAGGFHEGLTLVGEQGPELVNLPAGSYVNTASETAAMLRAPSGGMGGGGGGGNTTVIINMPPGSDGDDVVKALTRWQRRNGPVPISTR